jgi:hypothetical protein
VPPLLEPAVAELPAVGEPVPPLELPAIALPPLDVGAPELPVEPPGVVVVLPAVPEPPVPVPAVGVSPSPSSPAEQAAKIPRRARESVPMREAFMSSG